MLSKCKKWFIIPVFAIILMSHNTYALEISESVNLVANYGPIVWKDSNTSTWHSTYYLYSSNGDYSSFSNITVRPSTSTNANVTAGQYVSFVGMATMTSHSGGRYNDSATFTLSNDATDCTIIQLDTDVNNGTNNNTSTTQEQVTYRVIINGICRMDSAASNPTINLGGAVYTGTGVRSFRFHMYNFAVWNADTSLSVINTRLNEIKTSLTNIYSVLGDILDRTNDIADNMETQGEAAQKELDSTESIENQDVSDTSTNVENSQTTSLIGSLSGFLSAISSISATNCNVALQFPQFAGGTMTVNVCQNKEYTGNIVSVAGSILLVLFYLPLAFVMVNMIYREIRSFTNG